MEHRSSGQEPPRRGRFDDADRIFGDDSREVEPIFGDADELEMEPFTPEGPPEPEPRKRRRRGSGETLKRVLFAIPWIAFAIFITAMGGPVFAAADYHEYIYSVAPQFATARRPAYDARGSYSGTQVVTAISKRFPKYWVGAYISYQNLHNAAFADSPLVKQQSYVSAGIGIAWMIGKSKRMVEVEPDDSY